MSEQPTSRPQPQRATRDDNNGAAPGWELRWVERLLYVLGVALIGYFLWGWLEARWYNDYQLERLEILREQAAVAAAPGGASIGGATRRYARTPAAGELIGKIEIDRLGVSVAILEGMESQVLRRAVGHIPGTALPGQPGNVGVAGHRDSYFRALRDVRSGDRIELVTPAGTYEYVVSSTAIVGPYDTHVLEPADGRDLTLVTCYPFSYLGSAPERFVVHARQLTGDGR